MEISQVDDPTPYAVNVDVDVTVTLTYALRAYK